MDGKIYTRVKNQAIPVDGQNIHLFSCTISQPYELPMVTDDKYKQYEKNGLARIHCQNISSVDLSFHTISSNKVGPVKYQKTNDIIVMSKNGNTMIEIICKIDTIKMKEKCFIFIGGFKIHQSSVDFLTAMYQAKNINLLSKLLGSVDIINA